MLFLKSVMHYPNQNMGVRNAILQDSTNLKYAMSEILRDDQVMLYHVTPEAPTAPSH